MRELAKLKLKSWFESKLRIKLFKKNLGKNEQPIFHSNNYFLKYLYLLKFFEIQVLGQKKFNISFLKFLLATTCSKLHFLEYVGSPPHHDFYSLRTRSRNNCFEFSQSFKNRYSFHCRLSSETTK